MEGIYILNEKREYGGKFSYLLHENFLKFINSEKAKNFCEIFILLLTGTT